MTEYVWVTDTGTGYQGPLAKDDPALLSDAVSTDPEHPTHTANGELLPWVTETPAAETPAADETPIVSTETTTKKSGQAATSKEK